MLLDLSHILHECRTAFLRRIDAANKIMVSIGPSALWYFEWVHDACGIPSEHIGVEYYMPRPANLPERVRWLENTAGNMADLSSGIADIMFSGQNIEHLWQEEVASFLLEAHRVLKQGGELVIDSPNRLITALYGGAHPEHMVELTPIEAVDLLDAAGFDVESVRGILLCWDAKCRELLPVESFSDAPPHSIIDRCLSGIEAPNDSYIWWIHARRSPRVPDEERLNALVHAAWKSGWPERMSRLLTQIGEQKVVHDKVYYESAIGQAGALIYGPYAPVRAGHYRATLHVKLLSECIEGTCLGHLDVVFKMEGEEKSTKPLQYQDLSFTTYHPLILEFSIDETTFGFQMRLFSNGVAALSVEKRIDLELVS